MLKIPPPEKWKKGQKMEVTQIGEKNGSILGVRKI